MDSLRLFEESKLAHGRVSSGLSPAEAGVALVMVSPATLIVSRHRHNSTRLIISTDPPIHPPAAPAVLGDVGQLAALQRRWVSTRHTTGKLTGNLHATWLILVGRVGSASV
jgi:hypothetical protein